MSSAFFNFVTPVSSVRRMLMIVMGVGTLIIFFSVDISEFTFLGIRFEERAIETVFGLLCIYYSVALVFKYLIAVQMTRDLNDLSVDQLKQEIYDPVSPLIENISVAFEFFIPAFAGVIIGLNLLF